MLLLLAERWSNREIAQELSIALGTVKTHVHNVCQKLDANSRLQAVAQAKALGLL